MVIKLGVVELVVVVVVFDPAVSLVCCSYGCQQNYFIAQ